MGLEFRDGEPPPGSPELADCCPRTVTVTTQLLRRGMLRKLSCPWRSLCHPDSGATCLRGRI
eukprot:7644997-Lingulodinium_polyedra.AAC.1